MEGLGELLIGIAMCGNLIIAVYGILAAHRNAKNIQALEQNTNSKLDQLIKVTGEAERAKGVIQGRQER